MLLVCESQCYVCVLGVLVLLRRFGMVYKIVVESDRFEMAKEQTRERLLERNSQIATPKVDKQTEVA